MPAVITSVPTAKVLIAERPVDLDEGFMDLTWRVAPDVVNLHRLIGKFGNPPCLRSAAACGSRFKSI